MLFQYTCKAPRTQNLISPLLLPLPPSPLVAPFFYCSPPLAVRTEPNRIEPIRTEPVRGVCAGPGKEVQKWHLDPVGVRQVGAGSRIVPSHVGRFRRRPVQSLAAPSINSAVVCCLVPCRTVWSLCWSRPV